MKHREFIVTREISERFEQLCHQLVCEPDSDSDLLPVGKSLADVTAQLRADSSLRELIASLTAVSKEDGFVLVRGLEFDPENKILIALAGLFGKPIKYFGQPLIRDIKPEKGAASSNISGHIDEYPLHTDKSFAHDPPPYFILQCVQPDRGGHGTSIVSDAREAYALIDPSDRRVLREVPLSIKLPDHIPGSDHFQAYIVTGKVGQEKFRFRYDEMVSQVTTPELREAMKRFYQALLDVKKERLLKPHDAAIIDNFRVLHTRTRLSGYDSPRHLKRIYVG